MPSDAEWDLDEIHVTPFKNDSKPVCVGCNVSLDGSANKKRCDDCRMKIEAARAKAKRERFRILNPPKVFRTFICANCNQSWDTESLGHFNLCPTCKEKKALANRAKTCAYRYCGKAFHDMSSQNSMKFCDPECRRREKLFNSGLAKDLSYFRSDRLRKETVKCNKCGFDFLPEPNSCVIRCQSCREGLRNKPCRKCQSSYRDESLNNTRRYCDVCVKS